MQAQAVAPAGRPAVGQGDIPRLGLARDTIEKEVVKLSLENLRGFTWIRQADGRPTLSGMRFEIRTGVLSRVDEAGDFVPVAAG